MNAEQFIEKQLREIFHMLLISFTDVVSRLQIDLLHWHERGFA
jgi:hypothetical protein